MRITGYYRKFIEGFSKIAYPITSLQKKSNKLDWNEKCEAFFNKLKYLLTATPILKIIDPYKYFLACTNACKEGLGWVLIQKKYVIAYESRKLKEHENSYATSHDLELATIIHALKM